MRANHRIVSYSSQSEGAYMHGRDVGAGVEISLIEVPTTISTEKQKFPHIHDLVWNKEHLDVSVHHVLFELKRNREHMQDKLAHRKFTED
jgi:hypothetical protein